MSSSNTATRITISRTPKEWNIIEKRLQEIGRSDFTSYIIGRISLLERQYIDCPSCVCTSIDRRTQRQPAIGDKYYKVLNKISVKTGIPVSTIVDRLIVDPLILSK